MMTTTTMMNVYVSEIGGTANAKFLCVVCLLGTLVNLGKTNVTHTYKSKHGTRTRTRDASHGGGDRHE